MAVRTVTPDESRLAGRILYAIEDTDTYLEVQATFTSPEFEKGTHSERRAVLDKAARATGKTLADWQTLTGIILD